MLELVKPHLPRSFEFSKAGYSQQIQRFRYICHVSFLKLYRDLYTDLEIYLACYFVFLLLYFYLGKEHAAFKRKTKNCPQKKKKKKVP